jgi:hypothetical protein
MKELSTEHNNDLTELFSQAETEEEHTLVLTYRELQFLHQQAQTHYSDTVLCKLLHMAEVEAYDHIQKFIAERQNSIAQSIQVEA